MKPLSELKAEYMSRGGQKGFLRFDCPLCDPTHEIKVRFGPGAWTKIAGDSISNVTIQPSIRCIMPNCTFHGFVTNGVVTWVP